ncbi:conserved hypothetical protein [Hyella patelloides LEGE 07179]|uniref:Uncharacterized protein n=1 Tax=Hyella patelloides LEGE 07179 TaxID=945734 RepID=A0A563VQ66_9CYAN|nr:hypothetical protein [Hyella patelloides]VEP13573.1 conserved hypothetical protein [Hyella patelloides LEGE 07179]
MSEANQNLSAEKITFSVSPQQNVLSESKSVPITHQEKEIDWHKLAHKLREHNRKLLKKVFQLEQEVLESNQALEEQKKISQSHGLYAAKQAEKINQYQEEIAEMLQIIATYEQESQSKQSTLKKLFQQLECSETKVTQLEKDYACLEAANKVKNSEVLEQKQQIKELSNRFHRQQQYFLQHKASNYEKTGGQPIKAWSANLKETISLGTATLASDTNKAKAPDWPAPAIAKDREQVKSLAAIKLPQFPQKLEGE